MQNLANALEIAGRTDTGLVRDHNEDALFFESELGLVVLADGMGGYNAGEIASGVSVQVLAEVMRAQMLATPPHVKTGGSLWPVAHEMLLLAVDRANSMVYNMAQEHTQCAGMGTTLVAGVFYNDFLAIAHVGDSRAYRFRDEELVQLSKDHSFLQEQVDAGLISPEEALHAPYKNLVTRAVGIGAAVHTELHEYEVKAGDVYLFCSDGLSDMLLDETIAELLRLFKDNLHRACEVLIEQANSAGGRDNISVILVKVKHSYAAEENGIWNKLTGWLGSGL